MADSPTANESIRLKSLVFWLDRISKADDLAFIRRYWNTKDWTGYKKSYPVCPWCKGSPA